MQANDQHCDERPQAEPGFGAVLSFALTGCCPPEPALELLDAVLTREATAAMDDTDVERDALADQVERVVEIAAASSKPASTEEDRTALGAEDGRLLAAIDRAVASGAVSGRYRNALDSPPTLDAIAGVAYAELGFDAAGAVRLRRAVRQAIQPWDPTSLWSTLGYEGLQVVLGLDDTTFSRLTEEQCRRLVAATSTAALSAASVSSLVDVLASGRDVEAEIERLEPGG